jgi:hypothetical protein
MMDPDACFADFKLAVSEGRTQDATRHAGDLLEWLENGGYEPADFPELGHEWIWAYIEKEAEIEDGGESEG